jgi:NitT/TauT family transport system permease protein
MRPGLSTPTSPTHFSSKRRSRRARAVLERLAAPLLGLAVLAVWQAAVWLLAVSEFILPSPWAILKRIAVDHALLLTHAYATLFEVVAGFGLAALAGVPFALAIFYSRVMEKAVYPLLVALQTIPKVALAPLLVLYLGYGWAPKIFLAFLISFFPIVIATVVGLQSLDRALVHLVRAMGASEGQTFWKIRLPAALPNIFGGFKVGIALAVIGAVIGEYVAAERGLGYLQLQANSQFDTTLNFASIVVISLVGVVLYTALAAFEARLVFRREQAD